MDEATHQEVFGWVLRQVTAGGIVERKDDRHRRHYAGSQRCDEVDCSAQRRLIGSFQPGRLRQPLQVLGVALRRIAAHGSATQEEGLE